MNSKKSNSISLSIAIPAVIIAFIIGMFVRVRSTALTSAQQAFLASGQGELPVSSEEFNTFWNAWRILDSKYVEATSTKNQDKVYGAIKGLASSYGDPYTVFFPPVEAKVFNEDIAGNFSGVGMEIGIKNNQLTVVTPIKGSPAEKLGVKTGDMILTINGTSTVDMSIDQAVSYIRGPQGTVVKILFLPKGSTKPVERSITRAIINVPTIDTETKPGGISVIRLYSFTAGSPGLFREALRNVVVSGNNKIILDLRGNPGGYLDAAVDMASWFLPAGDVVVTEDFGSTREPNVFRSKVGYRAFNSNLKMIVLVDGGSASAAEILAGALAENGVAKLVGTKTFGKGSVQELIPLTSDTSLKVTVARWLTPKGHNLSHDGLDPDYVVPFTEKDAASSTDPQMAKALDLLK